MHPGIPLSWLSAKKFDFGSCNFHARTQAMYLLIQKKLIFDRPNCKSPYTQLVYLYCYLVCIISCTGKWRDYPIAVTAYSSFFGAVYVGLASIYFAATGREEEFIMPQAVSTDIYTYLHA